MIMAMEDSTMQHYLQMMVLFLVWLMVLCVHHFQFSKQSIESERSHWTAMLARGEETTLGPTQGFVPGSVEKELDTTYYCGTCHHTKQWRGIKQYKKLKKDLLWGKNDFICH